MYEVEAEGSSGKRVRDENLWQQSTFITISQEDEDEEMVVETHPRRKRARLLGENDLSSSSSSSVGNATSLTTTTTTANGRWGDNRGDIDNCITEQQEMMGDEENMPPVEWWRSQRRPTTTANQRPTTAPQQQRCCCFVCQTIMDPAHQPPSSSVNKIPMKPNNTLLNYSFTATAATARSHQEEQESQSSLQLQSCSFCDRPACLSCTRHCERCRAHFCTLCSTLDYSSSRTERCFCLDCLVVVTTTTADMSD